MNHGSLFSGIGGFDLAAEWMGWGNIFHCEWNEFGKKVLNYYWPQAISYHDITKTDFAIHRGQIDILTGGFPCQPYSAAGKRLGKEDDRHLWPEMLRAIREIQPTWVVGENVRGLTNWNGGLVFDEVQADLEAQGYEVTPFLLPACAVNAPHRRDRIWFVAYSYGNTRRATESNFNEEGQHIQRRTSRLGLQWTTTNAYGKRCNDRSDNRQERHIQGNERTTKKSKPEWQRWERGIGEIGSTSTNTNSIGFQGRTNGYESKSGTQPNDKQSEGCNKFSRKGWQIFPTQPPICSGDDGIPRKLDSITFPKWRSESIKAGGNAIVPQVAYEIFKVIQFMSEGKDVRS